MRIFQICKSFIFLILSFNTILKCILKNKKKAQFIILSENSQNLVDLRSKVHQKNNNINTFVNFVRTQNFFNGIRIYFKINNVIYFNHIFNIVDYFQSYCGVKRSRIIKNYIYILSLILRYIKIEEFFSIDDYRNIHIFSKACELSKSKLYIFQHGRISINLNYQKSLKNLKFEKFYVWSSYFKKKLIILNKNYKKLKIINFNKFSYSKIVFHNPTKKKNILVIQEDLVSDKTIIRLLKNIKNLKNSKIYFKFRPNNKINIKIKKFLIDNKIDYFYKQNILSIFKKYKINYLLASNSSLLLESSYFLIFPIMFYEKKPFLKDYVKDKVVFSTKIKDIKKMITKISKRRKDLINIKKRVWLN
jgi:hypothetical protein